MLESVIDYMDIPPASFVTVGQFLHNLTMDADLGLGWYFRGQGDCFKPLLPKAGRTDHFCRATKTWRERGQTSSDLGRFREWRHQAASVCPNLPNNDFECLAYAQHYGLATRLLDWTENPLVALFFACINDLDRDGAVFCYLPLLYIIDPDKAVLEELASVALFRPRPFDRRIAAQAGVFSVHPVPNSPLEPKEIPRDRKIWSEELKREVPSGMDLRAIRVPAQCKPMILKDLARIGISHQSLFPDLDGLARHVNWQTANIAGRMKSDGDDEE